MLKKDLNIKKKNVKNEVQEELEAEKLRIVKDLRNSDLDHKTYMEEIEKIKGVNDLLVEKKKKSLDPTIIVALINGVITIGTFAGLLVYENRDIIHAKAAERIVEKGIKR